MQAAGVSLNLLEKPLLCLYNLTLEGVIMRLSLHNWVLTTDTIIDGYNSWPHSHSFWNSLYWYCGQMRSLFKCEKTKIKFKMGQYSFLNSRIMDEHVCLGRQIFVFTKNVKLHSFTHRHKHPHAGSKMCKIGISGFECCLKKSLKLLFQRQLLMLLREMDWRDWLYAMWG